MVQVCTGQHFMVAQVTLFLTIFHSGIETVNILPSLAQSPQVWLGSHLSQTSPYRRWDTPETLNDHSHWSTTISSNLEKSLDCIYAVQTFLEIGTYQIIHLFPGIFPIFSHLSPNEYRDKFGLLIRLQSSVQIGTF